MGVTGSKKNEKKLFSKNHMVNDLEVDSCENHA